MTQPMRIILLALWFCYIKIGMTRATYHDKESTIEFPSLESCTILVVTDSASLTGIRCLFLLLIDSRYQKAIF